MSAPSESKIENLMSARAFIQIYTVMKITVIIWKSGQMNAPFEWASLFTAEKFNERPTLNERPPQNKKGVHIRKFAMSAEALIQIFCKNDETRVFFSQKFFVFYNKEIYKHIL